MKTEDLIIKVFLILGFIIFLSSTGIQCHIRIGDSIDVNAVDVNEVVETGDAS